jgi:hypothetical protein
MMKPTLAIALCSAGLLVALHACDYPAFQFTPGTGTGASTTTTASGGGGSGAGGSGNTGGTGNAGGSGNTGGTGNAGGTDEGGQGGKGGAVPCDPRDVDACPGEKCTVVDELTGATDCAHAGPLGAWSVCTIDADCAAHLWCDHATGVCKPMCESVDDCPDANTQCLPAAAEAGGTIPGLSLCVANCNPMSPACGALATCVYLDSPPLFDCFASLEHQDGDGCTTSSDCAAGLLCRGGTCRLWCNTPGDAGAWCKTFVWCCSIDPAPSYGGSELGYCACP